MVRVPAVLVPEGRLRIAQRFIAGESLLGLLKEGTGVAANVLKNLGANSGDVRDQVERLVPIASEAIAPGDLEHSVQARNVLKSAIEESQKLGHNWVGTEHILLGLMREQEGPVVQALANSGLPSEKVRSEVLLLLGHDVGGLSLDGQVSDFEVKTMTLSSGEDAHKALGLLGPHIVDHLIRQAISMCWMMLPSKKKSTAAVESEIRRLVERALTDLKDDARAFGIPQSE